MTALTRAQADVDRGDLGSARRRVASFISSTTYRPDVLAMAADISFKMHDPVQAGRYWLLTPAIGPEVEDAIEAFARACHHDAQVMASEMPRFKERCKVAAYPEVVRERLARYGVDVVFQRQDPDLAPVGKSGWKQKAKALGCLVVALGLVLLIAVVLRVVRRAWCG